MKANVYLITYTRINDNEEFTFSTNFICLCDNKLYFNQNLLFHLHEELSLHDIKDLKISFNK